MFELPVRTILIFFLTLGFRSNQSESKIGCIGILSLFFWILILFFIIIWGVLFSFLLLFLGYYFISFYTHIMCRVYIDILEFVLETFITFINLSINSKLLFYLFSGLRTGIWIESFYPC